MPESIQRYPAGLLNLLGMQSLGDTPPALSPLLIPVVDLMQSYGLAHRQLIFTINGAVVSGAALSHTTGIDQQWSVLFTLTATLNVTATMPFAQMFLGVNRGGGLSIVAHAFDSCALVGAVGPAHILTLSWTPPYPLILPKGSVLQVTPTFTVDATAGMTIQAEVGFLP
jgi:hypothetical protein